MTATNGLPRNLLGELGSTGLQLQLGRPDETRLRAFQADQWPHTVADMLRDDMVGAVLFAAEQLIRQVSWQVVPASNDAEAEADAEFVDGCREDMSFSWQDTLSEILSMLPWGWSYFELVYKVRGGDTPDDPTTRSRYDDGKIGWRKWAVRSQETLERWQFDPDGGVQAMVQRTPEWQTVAIPIEKALLFRTTSRKNNPEGTSILKGAYKPWYFKTHIQRIEGVGIERDLAGLPVVWGPPELFQPDATPEQKALFETLKRIATNIKRDEQEGLVFPLAYDEKGNKLYDIQLLSTGGRRQFDTDTIVQRYDLRIAMSVLADFILLGSRQVGSYALASSKTNLFAVALGAWLDTIADVVNRFAIPRLLRLNGRPVTGGLPTLQHGDVETVDWGEFGDALEKLVRAGLVLSDEDWRAFRERLGMPVPDETEAEQDDDQDEDDEQEQQQEEQERAPGTGEPAMAGSAEQ
ncbi:MAG: phage portal protein family protein [Chloroflexota bacterium]